MKPIGNKKAAITVMRPTRSFSLWEMTLRIYNVYLRYTQLLRKNYGTVPLKFRMQRENQFPVFATYFSVSESEGQNKRGESIEYHPLETEWELPASFREFHCIGVQTLCIRK